MSDEPEAEYGLVVPFVVCQSQGGPYEDCAFVAGYECGRLDAELALDPDFWRGPLRSASMPQIDLIAMRHGYSIAAEPWDEHPEWALVFLTKPAAARAKEGLPE